MKQLIVKPVFVFLALAPMLLSMNPYADKVYIVRMEGMKFLPKQLEIPEGATICWINESNGSHNVVDKEGLFKSEMLTGKGDKYQYRFLKKGTYSYYCAPHRIMGMKGTIVVK